jgi:hypothetical protein
MEPNSRRHVALAKVLTLRTAPLVMAYMVETVAPLISIPAPLAALPEGVEVVVDERRRRCGRLRLAELSASRAGPMAYGSWKIQSPLSRSLARMYSWPVAGWVQTSTPQKLLPPAGVTPPTGSM